MRHNRDEDTSIRLSAADICAVMETYTELEIPFLYFLAKNYAVSDEWFSSVPTQTNPNRAFSVCGTSEGQFNNGSLVRSSTTAAKPRWPGCWGSGPGRSRAPPRGPWPSCGCTPG